MNLLSNNSFAKVHIRIGFFNENQIRIFSGESIMNNENKPQVHPERMGTASQ